MYGLILTICGYYAVITLYNAIVSGWLEMASEFKAISGDEEGQWVSAWDAGSLSFGRATGKQGPPVSKIAVTDEGVYLSAMSFFRLWHPQLFIAWNRILKVQEINEGDFLTENYYLLSLDAKKPLKLLLTTQLFYKALAAMQPPLIAQVAEGDEVFSCDGTGIGRITQLHQTTEISAISWKQYDRYFEVVSDDGTIRYYVPMYAIYRYDSQQKRVHLFANKNGVRWDGWVVKPAFVDI